MMGIKSVLVYMNSVVSSNGRLGRVHVLLEDLLLVDMGVDVLLDLVEIDIGDDGLFSVEDLGNLLEGRALGLDVEEVDEDELGEVPDLL